MNKLSSSDRIRVVACLVEGNSLRATVRMTGVHRTTVMKLLVDLGEACSAFQDKAFRNLTGKRIQCDEIWSFVGCKEKNVPTEKRHQGRGDVWTWTAIDAETKLVPAWYVGNRDAGAAYHFMHDLAGRLANRVQLTTDAHRPYRGGREMKLNPRQKKIMKLRLFAGLFFLAIGLILLLHQKQGAYIFFIGGAAFFVMAPFSRKEAS